ncbi:DUF3313 domain-containing protein [Marinihelvus fidelis]|uniref:DUF3313 domain-containing protein n=1 Tax=Marinihelvus fidelis TaxID=2613842 RepID=A0A5N0TGE0_9GAMM|nr:DUF3313 family protein [Marinihelvus fidelis]KAA9134155.1 DUF3313 domain-containing protein [Marinihelvus fidelis]
MSGFHSKSIAPGCRSLVLALMVATSAAVAKDDLPDVDSNGLHRLHDTKADLVYAKPGADLSNYTEVMLVDCFVQFKKNWERDYNLGEVGLQGRVMDKDIERIKKGVAEEFNKVFSEVLTKKGYKVVDAPADGVLAVRPAILNLDVTAPDLRRGGPSITWVQSAGSMTLYMELYDAPKDELIARVVDSRADDHGMREVANSVTNRAAADRMLRSWAEQLADHLGAVSQ